MHAYNCRRQPGAPNLIVHPVDENLFGNPAVLFSLIHERIRQEDLLATADNTVSSRQVLFENNNNNNYKFAATLFF